MNLSAATKKRKELAAKMLEAYTRALKEGNHTVRMTEEEAKSVGQSWPIFFEHIKLLVSDGWFDFVEISDKSCELRLSYRWLSNKWN